MFAVIGDVHVRIWGSWHDTSCQFARFDRPHEYKTCKESHTLRHGMQLLVLTVGTSDGVRLNLDTMQQQACKLDIPSHSTPTYYDGRHLLLLQITPSGLKLMQLYDVQQQRLLHTLPFDKVRRHYWGFQLVDSNITRPLLTPEDAAATEAAAAAAAEANGRDGASALLPPLPSHHHLAYVCCHSKVNLIPLTSLPGPLTSMEAEQAHAEGTLRTGSAAATVTANTHSNGVDVAAAAPAASASSSFKVLAHSGAGRVLSFSFDVPSRTLTTLGNDGKLKLFALDETAARAAGVSEREISAGQRRQADGSAPGILIRKYRHMPGTFKLGYPYMMRRIGRKLVCYTADEGIFMITL